MKYLVALAIAAIFIAMPAQAGDVCDACGVGPSQDPWSWTCGDFSSKGSYGFEFSRESDPGVDTQGPICPVDQITAMGGAAEEYGPWGRQGWAIVYIEGGPTARVWMDGRGQVSAYAWDWVEPPVPLARSALWRYGAESAAWSGRIAGVSNELGYVDGDFEIKIALATLDGSLEAELGRYGRLEYAISVARSAFSSVDGEVVGRFSGVEHQYAHGHILRDDLAAAFAGGRRGAF